MISKENAVDALKEFSLLLDLLDQDPQRSKAFDTAARALDDSPHDFEELILSKKLSSVRGIGKTMESVISALAKDGTFPDLEAARNQVPSGVLGLLRVDGLGPKKARTLWKTAKIESVEDLNSAIRAGKLAGVSGFGQKTLDNFLASIAFIQKNEGRHLRHAAIAISALLHDKLQRLSHVNEIFFGGSLRRQCETSADLDVLLFSDLNHLDEIRRELKSIPDVLWNRTDGLIWSGIFAGMMIEISVSDIRESAHRKLLATGSKSHLIALSNIAKQRKLELTETGLRDTAGHLVHAQSEKDLYHALNLEPVPPYLREDESSLHAAGTFKFPAPLTLNDIRGILHVHTTYSDGANTLRQMAEAAIAAGVEYLGIADHSKIAAYAGGLSPDRVREQWKEINQLNDELAPFRILKGTECDILADGSLDFNDELLSQFDFVVASIHSGLKMDEETATNRVCRALENPHMDILGHSSGRLLLKREGYLLNYEKVIETAAKHGKMIELNADPRRLDIDWRWIGRCMDAGIPVPINPDAHSADGLKNMRYGLDVAAKAMLTAEFCPSAWDVKQLIKRCN